MTCIVLADLHLDKYAKLGRDPFEHVPRSACEGITHCMIAGDLSDRAHKRWTHCIQWLQRRFPNAQVIVMPGNHDYYDFWIDEEARLAAVAEEYRATFAQKLELTVGAHRFLFATLWTDFELYGDRLSNMNAASSVMSDYRYIRIKSQNYRRLTPSRTATIHQDHKAWLIERLAEPFAGETTVITHHAPHLRALSDRPTYGPCYASDMEGIIHEYQPARWLYGHTHHPTTFRIGRTELRNVSVGYPRQNLGLRNLDRFAVVLD